MFKFILSITNGRSPFFRMADGAWEITKAGKEVCVVVFLQSFPLILAHSTLAEIKMFPSIQVFGEEGIRLMCWAHVFRNVRPKLAAIRKANLALGESILADIESIQWMAQSEAEFDVVCNQLKSHYLEQELSERERTLVTDFMDYFLSQWGPGSHTAQWYAGAHPFSLTNNQVISCFLFGRKFNS